MLAIVPLKNKLCSQHGHGKAASDSYTWKEKNWSLSQAWEALSMK